MGLSWRDSGQRALSAVSFIFSASPIYGKVAVYGFSRTYRRILENSDQGARRRAPGSRVSLGACSPRRRPRGSPGSARA